MSESKQQWTPGPWPIRKSGSESYLSIGPLIADGYSGGSWISAKEADVNLASAAPELVEALQEAMRAASDTLFVLREMLENDYEHTHPRLENLAEALDKATDVGYAALAKAGA